MITRLLAALLVVSALGAFAGAEDIVVSGVPGYPVVGPVTDPVVGPVVVGPVVGPYYGPRHWIYDYLPTYDHQSERYGVGGEYRRYDNRSGLKAYPGRSTLEPAVPYSDYMAQQRQLQAVAPPAPATAVTPSADRAILDFTLPAESAKLWLDNQPVDGSGKTRTMQTPPLTPGQEYKFAVKVTWPSSSLFEDRSTEQIVTFRAGERKTIEIREKN
jgi:uncharacterized protein (TIGR03000 family)